MDFSYNNAVLWNFINQMGILAAILLLANIIRRKVPFIRKALVPTAVLAGFIALLVRLLNIVKLENSQLEIVTYHTIAIGFIALSLIIPNRDGNYSRALIGSKTGALITSYYLLQGSLGLIVSIGLAYTIRPGLFKAAGILLAMGFGQGPGQANNVGLTYEALGFVGGQSFGLSIAAMGFVVACAVGVLILNVLERKKLIRRHGESAELQTAAISEYESKNEIPISESIDKFSIQVALVLFVYFVTWLMLTGITKLLETANANIAQTLVPVIWGFNFIFGALLAVCIRGLIRAFRNFGWMTHQYQNNYLLSRISGYSFDLMIVTGICTINFEKLTGLWLPFILMCVLGTVFTFLYLKWICKILYPDYYYEAFLSLFGMATGLISSGMLLLREVDPKFQTPAANNLLLGSSFAIGFAFPLLILIGVAPKSDTLALVTLGCCIGYFLLLLLYMLGFKRKRAGALS